jgi:Zn-dependent protease with chaperone function
VLGDSLIESFTPDAIETILAQELAHQVNRDIPLGIVFQTALTLAGLYLASLGMQAGVRWFGFSDITVSLTARQRDWDDQLGEYGKSAIPSWSKR